MWSGHKVSAVESAAGLQERQDVVGGGGGGMAGCTDGSFLFKTKSDPLFFFPLSFYELLCSLQSEGHS